ncbi:MAG: exo-alpha-sialidase [Planctomycetota bacterium]|nr:MAG: exo-alpha-sialidase [Planctomycetota bacterium]
MRKSFLIPLAGLVCAGSLAAQNPRAYQDLTPAAAGAIYSPSVVSDGDMSAILYNDSGDKGVYVVVGNGHGTAWGTPVRLDSDTTMAEKRNDTFSLVMDGSTLVAVWRDGRNNTSTTTTYYDTWVSVSNDGGQTWSPDQILDKGGYPYGGSNTVLAVKAAISGPHIYVAQLIDNGNDELWVLASHDGGLTWGTAVNASTVTNDIDNFAIGADGLNCYVAWDDDRNALYDDDLWFRMSHDGLATWMAPEAQIDASGPANGDIEYGGIFMTVDGPVIGLCWEEDELPSSMVDEELHWNVSTDGGHTWGTEVVLQTGFDTDNHWMDYNGGTFAVAWEDNRNLADEAFVAVSHDLGATWTETQLSAGGAAYPRVVVGGDYIGADWGGPSYPENPMAAVSRDGGMTWLPAQDLAMGGQPGDADYVELGFNAKYNNFVAAWLSDDTGINHLYVGGERCQTLTPVGNFTPGGTVGFQADNFGASEAGTGFGTLVAAGPGNYTIPFGGGYDTGLANDAYLNFTLGLNPGPLSGGLDAAGHGSTSTLNVPLSVPVGTVLHCVGVGYSVNAGVVTIGSITDVTTVTVQ